MSFKSMVCIVAIGMMVSRKVLDEVGIFDPDFFMYSE